MKEDYLWDKTGEDAEIEKLENALQVFRYKETAPPELPAKILPFRTETASRRTFPSVLAAAACLVFGIVALGVWLQILRHNIVETGEDLSKTNETRNEVILPQAATTAKNDDLPIQKVENSKQPAQQKFAEARQDTLTNMRRKEPRAQKIKAVKPPVRLTKEEKYAYDQLMLALSITGSKFKLVKDKVEGIEEKNAVLGNGQ